MKNNELLRDNLFVLFLISNLCTFYLILQSDTFKNFNVIMLLILFTFYIIIYFSKPPLALILLIIFLFLYSTLVMLGLVTEFITFSSFIYYWLGLYTINSSILIGYKYFSTSTFEKYSNLTSSLNEISHTDSEYGVSNFSAFYSSLNIQKKLSVNHNFDISIVVIEIAYFETIKLILGKTSFKSLINIMCKNIDQEMNCNVYLVSKKPPKLAFIVSTNKLEKVIKIVQSIIDSKELYVNLSKVNFNVDAKIGVYNVNNSLSINEIIDIALKQTDYDPL